jgi:hypothetical protein
MKIKSLPASLLSKKVQQEHASLTARPSPFAVLSKSMQMCKLEIRQGPVATCPEER